MTGHRLKKLTLKILQNKLVWCMVTPQITVRVNTETLNSWKERCEAEGVSVSEKIRQLMNGWVKEDWPPGLEVK